MNFEDLPIARQDGTAPMWLKRLGVFITSTGEDCIKPHDVKEVRGERGILDVYGHEFHTIERTSTMRIPAKIIECVMEENKTRGKIFRLTAEGLLGHGKKTMDGVDAGLLIHAASFPYQLSGCLAPGRIILTTGVGESRGAMADIFTALGGFGAGRKVLLNVLN
ncbi:MAG: hypothetical protein ABJA66_03530 [Actinomycetota bacterium]